MSKTARTIVQYAVQSGRRLCWRAQPMAMAEIVWPEVGHITEVRWELDFEDPKHPVVKIGTIKIVRASQEPPWPVEFINDPADLIRYAYRLRKDSGETVTIGDQSLFADDLTDEYERERIEQLAMRIGLIRQDHEP